MPCITNHSRSATSHWRNHKYRPRSSSVSINESLNKYNYIPEPCECNTGFDLESYQTAKVTVDSNSNYSGNIGSAHRRSFINRGSIRNTIKTPSSSSSTSDERDRRPRSTKRKPSVTIKEDIKSGSKHSGSSKKSDKKKSAKNKSDTKKPAKKSSSTSNAKKKSNLKPTPASCLAKRKMREECSSSEESTSAESSEESAKSCESQDPRHTGDACFGTASLRELTMCPPPGK